MTLTQVQSWIREIHSSVKDVPVVDILNYIGSQNGITFTKSYSGISFKCFATLQVDRLLGLSVNNMVNLAYFHIFYILSAYSRVEYSSGTQEIDIAMRFEICVLL